MPRRPFPVSSVCTATAWRLRRLETLRTRSSKPGALTLRPDRRRPRCAPAPGRGRCIGSCSRGRGRPWRCYYTRATAWAPGFGVRINVFFRFREGLADSIVFSQQKGGRIPLCSAMGKSHSRLRLGVLFCDSKKRFPDSPIPISPLPIRARVIGSIARGTHKKRLDCSMRGPVMLIRPGSSHTVTWSWRGAPTWAPPRRGLYRGRRCRPFPR